MCALRLWAQCWSICFVSGLCVWQEGAWLGAGGSAEAALHHRQVFSGLHDERGRPWARQGKHTLAISDSERWNLVFCKSVSRLSHLWTAVIFIFIFVHPLQRTTIFLDIYRHNCVYIVGYYLSLTHIYLPLFARFISVYIDWACFLSWRTKSLKSREKSSVHVLDSTYIFLSLVTFFKWLVYELDC